MTVTAENLKKNSLDTGTLTYSDIRNVSEYDAKGISLSAGFNSNKNTVLKDPDTIDQHASSTKGVSKSIGFGLDSDKDSSVTKSGINTSNITIRDEQGQQALTGKTAEQIKSDILTSVTTDTARENSGALKNNFDKDKVQSEINLQMEVTKKFGENAPKAVADFAESKADALRKQGQENEARKWDEGGVYRVAAHSALGALMGGDLTSTLATGTTAASAPTLNKIQDQVQSSLEASGLSKSVAEGLSGFVTTAAAFGIGNTIGGNTSTGGISANIDMNNRQLHIDEIAMLKKEAAKLATQNGQMSRDGYEYWFTLLYSVAYSKVDTKGREQLMSMAKQWDEAGKNTNDFSLQQLSKNITYASKIVNSMAGKVITDSSNKPIIENGSVVKAFQATDSQRQNTSLFGYDLKTAGLKAKDDPKSYGSSGTANKTAQGTVRRENEDLVDGLEKGSKGVVPVYPEMEVIGLGAGKLGKEIAEKAIKTVENQVAKQVVKDAEKEAVKKQVIENNFYNEGDSFFANIQIDLKNKAAQIRTNTPNMFDVNGKPLGNLATGTIRIDGLPVQEVKAFSGYGNNMNQQIEGFVGLSNKKPILKPVNNPNSPINRVQDTEYKILENFAQTYKDNPNVKGSIDLFTERAPCKSCTNVIQEQFSQKYPNVQVRVYHDNGNYSIYQGGKLVSAPMGKPINPHQFPTAPTFNKGIK